MNEDPSSTNSKTWLDRLTRAFNGQPRDRGELRDVLSDAGEQGILDSDALVMMEGALEVAELHVRDVMVPRSRMVVVPLDSTLEESLPRIIESGHSRFPVVGEDKDQVHGILLAKDLLRHFAADSGTFSLQQYLRAPVIIPESKRLNVLLREFRASRNHMAIVVDEYGGVSGLITIEDVLEEIVGEIDDEHDTEEDAPITRIGEGRFIVKALTPIEDFNERFEAELDDSECDTVGGLVLSEVGRVPEFGEVVAVDDFDFQVVRADNRRIHLLELKLPR